MGREDVGLLMYERQHSVDYVEKAEVLGAFFTLLITSRTFSLIPASTRTVWGGASTG